MFSTAFDWTLNLHINHQPATYILTYFVFVSGLKFFYELIFFILLTYIFLMMYLIALMYYLKHFIFTLCTKSAIENKLFGMKFLILSLPVCINKAQQRQYLRGTIITYPDLEQANLQS